MRALESLLRSTLWPSGPSGIMVRSAQGLISAKFAAMALGFGFWLAVARLVPAEEVGLASGLIAASLLIVQLSLFGIDGALVLLSPRYESSFNRLFVAAAGTVTVVAVLFGLAFLAFAQGFMHELGTAASDPVLGVVFVLMAVVGTLSALLDRGSMARRRGHEVILRSGLNGLVTIVPLLAVPLLGASFSGRDIFGFWVVGTGVATVIGALQLRHDRPRAVPGDVSIVVLAEALLRRGPRYYALALAERAPVVALPVVITEVISPTAMAHWYPVWMMAWAVFMIPAAHGAALFAEGARGPSELRAGTERAIRSALTTGYAVALGVAVGGWPLLYLLGPDYAAEGIVPLLILLLALGPLSVNAMYYSSCRATGRIREAVITSILAGSFSLVCAGVGGSSWGLVGLSAGWALAQVPVGVWTFARNRHLTTDSAEWVAVTDLRPSAPDPVETTDD